MSADESLIEVVNHSGISEVSGMGCLSSGRRHSTGLRSKPSICFARDAYSCPCRESAFPGPAFCRMIFVRWISNLRSAFGGTGPFLPQYQVSRIMCQVSRSSIEYRQQIALTGDTVAMKYKVLSKRPFAGHWEHSLGTSQVQGGAGTSLGEQLFA